VVATNLDIPTLTIDHFKDQSDTQPNVSISVASLQSISLPKIQSQTHRIPEPDHKYQLSPSCQSHRHLQSLSFPRRQFRGRATMIMQLILIVQMLLAQNSMAKQEIVAMSTTPVSPPSFVSRDLHRLRELKIGSGRKLNSKVKRMKGNEISSRSYEKSTKEESNKFKSTDGGDATVGDGKSANSRKSSTSNKSENVKDKENSKGNTDTPTKKPHKKPTASPSSFPTSHPSFSPTTSRPTVTPGSPTLAPVKWLEAETDGQFTLELSILLRPVNATKDTDSGIVTSLNTVAPDRLRNVAHRKPMINGEITAKDIIDGGHTKILHAVLTTMMNALCEKPYILLTSASAVDGKNPTEYVNYCSKSSVVNSKSRPRDLYDRRSTVLLANMTGSSKNLEIIDRMILVQTTDPKAYERIIWQQWKVTYDIVETGTRQMNYNDGDIDEVIKQIKKNATTSLKEYWTNGTLNDDLKKKNGLIIASSLVGNEPDVFIDAMQKYYGLNYDHYVNATGYDTDTTIAEIKSDTPKDSDKYVFFAPIRIIGFGLLCAIVVITIFLTNQASKRYEHNSWDATYLGDLVTEEGVEKMLCSGRENVITSEKKKDNWQPDGPGYMPAQYPSNP